MTNPPKERGTAWERRVADHAMYEFDLSWDRAPLRGKIDTGDLTSWSDGWETECKAISRKGNLADRLSTGMLEAQLAARVTIPRVFPALGPCVPVVIAQRQGYGVGKAYAVLELDDFLAVVLERRKWQANQ